MSQKENPMQKIITKCWQDEEFKEKLMADPAATLRAEGGPVPEGIKFKVVAEDEHTIYIVIPPKPEMLGDELLAQEYGGFQGGGFQGGFGCQAGGMQMGHNSTG